MTELHRSYHALGLELGSSLAVIQERYKLLILAWHPDRFVTPEQKRYAEEEMKKINNARDVLKAHFKIGRHHFAGHCACKPDINSTGSATHKTTGAAREKRNAEQQRRQQKAAASQHRDQERTTPHEQDGNLRKKLVLAMLGTCIFILFESRIVKSMSCNKVGYATTLVSNQDVVQASQYKHAYKVDAEPLTRLSQEMSDKSLLAGNELQATPPVIPVSSAITADQAQRKDMDRLHSLRDDMHTLQRQMHSTNESWLRRIDDSETKLSHIREALYISSLDQSGRPKKLTVSQDNFYTKYIQEQEKSFNDLTTLTAANPAFREYQNYRNQYNDDLARYNAVARKYAIVEIQPTCPEPLGFSQKDQPSPRRFLIGSAR